MVAGDMVRALALASVVVGTWRAGLVAGALFLLVLGGTLACVRSARRPGWTSRTA